MASIQDVADQINAKLDTISASTTQTASNTSQAVSVLQDIRGQAVETNNRLDNLADGLFALIELQRSALHLLDHHRRQHDTIICELVNGNTLLCGMTRKLTDLVTDSRATLVTVERMEGIAERLHAGEAADFDRDLELDAKIEACCPPRPTPPEPCPKPCDTPAFDPVRPDGQDWKPLDDNNDPIR